MDKPLSDQQIIKSWKKNVDPWVQAIRDDEIQSRVLVTNKAIVDAVLALSPNTVLDVGCGEGWLTRALAQSGIDVLGVDVVPELIEVARKTGDGRFQAMAYEQMSAQSLNQTFDAVVCNFSLLGDESVEHLFSQVDSLLNEGGRLVVQTIHPVAGCGDGTYQDGWRAGAWAGFSQKLSEQFTDPAPWYFRTMDAWKGLFLTNALALEQVIEPLNPETQSPASVIFVGRKIAS